MQIRHSKVKIMALACTEKCARKYETTEINKHLCFNEKQSKQLMFLSGPIKLFKLVWHARTHTHTHSERRTHVFSQTNDELSSCTNRTTADATTCEKCAATRSCFLTAIFNQQTATHEVTSKVNTGWTLADSFTNKMGWYKFNIWLFLIDSTQQDTIHFFVFPLNSAIQHKCNLISTANIYQNWQRREDEKNQSNQLMMHNIFCDILFFFYADTENIKQHIVSQPN